MFVINLKMDYKKILFFCIICATIIASIIEFGFNDTSIFTNASIDDFYYNVTEDNFVSSLKLIHENIDENIGRTIKVSGFVYTLPDFKEDFFVCGRYLETEDSTQVAGYLFNYNGDMELNENEWIEICGTIIKGDYNGSVPVIKVDQINKIVAPANTYVKEK
ncbi:MAG: hypothetical protein J6A15_01890 [Clostridia bacterium]|nr:hypothetical protein [Clostridia bacterium]